MRDRPLLWIFISALSVDVGQTGARQWTKVEESWRTDLWGWGTLTSISSFVPTKWKDQPYRVLSQIKNSRGEAGIGWWGKDAAVKRSPYIPDDSTLGPVKGPQVEQRLVNFWSIPKFQRTTNYYKIPKQEVKGINNRQMKDKSAAPLSSFKMLSKFLMDKGLIMCPLVESRRISFWHKEEWSKGQSWPARATFHLGR